MACGSESLCPTCGDAIYNYEYHDCVDTFKSALEYFESRLDSDGAGYEEFTVSEIIEILKLYEKRKK